MANACVFTPKKGIKTFQKLKNEFGYDEAWKIYGIAMNSKFQNDYKDSLSFDTEGVPSFNSLIQNDYIMKVAGSNIRKYLGKNLPKRDDSIENFNLTLEDAKTFNDRSPYNKNFVAVVGYDDEGRIAIQLLGKTEENEKKFANQYATYKLNMRLAEILKSLGVSVGLLQEIEQSSGRVGVTDFSVAKLLATDSISMVRVANNMEGAKALSEEFAHLIIGAMRGNPLIQRNINTLANEDSLREILGDDYQDVYDFYEGDMKLMAEEALGHILQEKLLESVTSNDIQGRLINQVQRKFKRIKESEIVDAIHEAESSMSTIAKGILGGNLTLSKKDIINSQRDVQFNALSEQVERNIKILKGAIAVESKRYKIIKSNEDSKKYAESIVNALEHNMNTDTALGVLTYAREALSSLKVASNTLSTLNTMSPEDKFKLLMGIKSTIQSYSQFIDNLNDLALDDKNDADYTKDFVVTDHNGDKEVVNMKSTLTELNSLYKLIGRDWLRIALPSFAEYLKPVLGEKITIEMGSRKGVSITIEELLKSSESDISYLDRWLDSMGNSSDILLRAFDKIYKNALDKARLQSIKDFRRIQALRMEAESYGITTFNWMFERDREGNFTGNYVSEVNSYQYYQDRDRFEEELSEKYGKNPKGDNLKAKLAERERWHEEHSDLTILGTRIPKESVYRNEDFYKLSDKQQLIRKKFLEIKTQMDKQYPSNRVSELKAIQLRKDGVQRFIDSGKDPSTIFSNIKEHLADEFLERTDDDTIFGGRTSLTDFAGKEFMTLPVLYTNRLENPNELSTDIFGSLMAYTAASNNYREMDRIIDPLETGRTLIKENRKVKTTRGGMNLVEKFKALGKNFQNEAIESGGSYIEDRLDDFFASQIYHKYLKDSGIFEIFGKNINKNKIVSALKKESSMVQLGFNFLTNLANVTTGVSMQNIEAAAGEFFNAKELAKADSIYVKLIPGNIAEFNSRTKTNRLSLFNELFNIRQDFDDVSHHIMRKSALARIFSSEIAYIGQGAGDHWLYMRTAIAMALRERVNVPGKGEMSLWEALQIEDTFDGNDKIKEMRLPEGTTGADGKPFDIGKFGRKIAHVNQSLFGIYNTEDRNAAQRVIMGRLLLQYRNWMKPQFNRRFQRGQFNLDTQSWEEGYYRTSGRILRGLIRGQYQLGAVWQELKPEERANVKRAITEMLQLCIVMLLAEFIKWPDDKDRPWAIKLAEYTSRRLEHELGTLAPSPMMLQEMLKTIKSPVASITQVQNLINLFSSLSDPRDWNNEIESGRYKGMSTLEKNLLKSGLPGFAQFRQLDRLIYDIDNSIIYYARPY